MTPKTANERKTLAGWRALPYAKMRRLSHCAWNYLYPIGLCRCAILRHLRSIRRSVSKPVMQHSSSRLYWLVWTMETRHSLDSQISRSLNYNRSSILPLVWFSCRVSLITWRRIYVNYIGCPFLRGLITSWRCWFSGVSMVWHRRILPANSVVWPTHRVVSGCARRRQRNS